MAKAPRTGSVRTLSPAGLLDITDQRVVDHTGHQVEVTQPFGCPKNGTMGMCYVDCIDCSDTESTPGVFFIGLVNIASLEK